MLSNGKISAGERMLLFKYSNTNAAPVANAALTRAASRVLISVEGTTGASGIRLGSTTLRLLICPACWSVEAVGEIFAQLVWVGFMSFMRLVRRTVKMSLF